MQTPTQLISPHIMTNSHSVTLNSNLFSGVIHLLNKINTLFLILIFIA
jgi:hypothetical protein